MPVPSQDVSVVTELAYFSCRPGREALVHFEEDTVHEGENCCKEKIELLAGLLVKD